MRAALIIRAEPLAQNKGLSEMMECMASLTAMAKLVTGPVKLVMQHNIREDHFVVLVETSKRTFGHHGENFQTVFKSLRKEVERFVDKELHHEELRPAAKQAAGEKSSKGHGRNRPEGKRVKRLRQG